MARIAIDIGHGINTFPPSKGVYRGGKGYAEHDFNSKLAIRLKKLLEDHGHSVFYGPQKPNSPDVGLTTRTNWYNRNRIDLVVSIHANANNNPNVNGRCVFYWHTSSKGRSLANRIIKEIKAKGYSTHGNGLHASRRGSWTNLHITRVTNMPAVLIEHGFMTGNRDFQLIFGSKQDQYIEDMAQADAKAIVEYFGGSYKPSKNSSTSKPTTIAGAVLVKNENAFFKAEHNIKVRSQPSTRATHTGTLPKGASINYKRVFHGNGHRWLEYTGYSGRTLYLPYRRLTGDTKPWGTFHSKRP